MNWIVLRFPVSAMRERTRRKAARDFDPVTATASAVAGSFKSVAENWLKHYVDRKQLRSKDEIVRQLVRSGGPGGFRQAPIAPAGLLRDTQTEPGGLAAETRTPAGRPGSLAGWVRDRGDLGLTPSELAVLDMLPRLPRR